MTLSQHDLRRAAVAAGCDPRTVARRLRGERQPSPIRARIDDALRALGFTPATEATPEARGATEEAPPVSQARPAPWVST